jgi:Fur family ferric uptake transcriptional regulator
MTRRNTIQKNLVLSAVRRLRNHATADEIYNLIVREHPSIGRGTVYRNLNILAESGEILRVGVPGQADHFDHTCHKHYHVFCMECGRVYDVDMEPLPDLMEKIRNTHGFEFLDYDIVFKGICPGCREQKNTLFN